MLCYNGTLAIQAIRTGKLHRCGRITSRNFAVHKDSVGSLGHSLQFVIATLMFESYELFRIFLFNIFTSDLSERKHQRH